jgi:hypothetical protein
LFPVGEKPPEFEVQPHRPGQILENDDL